MKDLFDNLFGLLIIPIGFGMAGIVWWYFLRDSTFQFATALSILLFILPLTLPFLLWYLTYDRWMEFVNTMFYYENKRVSLRLRLPQEVFKSPQAMESVFTHIYAPNNSDNLYEAYIMGKQRQPVACEIVSIGGEVRLYMNVHKKIKDILESQLYSQYPGIEVEEELLDYTSEVKWDPDTMDMLSLHVTKKNDAIYPIKTYIDFGLDKMPKEEEKFEPMAALIEFLSKALPHERIFIQIVATPHAKKEFKYGNRSPEGTWEAEAAAKINEMMGRDQKKQTETEETESRPMLTMGERDTITAMERNTSKLAFDVGIRTMYITLDKDKFDGGKIGPMFGSFKQYGVIGRNELAPRWKTAFDYSMFEDFSGSRRTARKQSELEQYKMRIYDAGSGSSNAGHQPKAMSVEELATIFHIPGSSVLTPGLSRVATTRRTAPSNLPTGELPI